MAKPSLHVATGQMLGYLFQPDRALMLLCTCRRNESVSIELVDDVAIEDENGIIIYREQDKSTIKKRTEPFKARSKDLWNTLLIWWEAVQSGQLNIDTTKLLCACNMKVGDKSLIRIIANAEKEEDINSVLALLKTAAINPPVGIKNASIKVLSDEKILKKIISKVNLSDDNNYDKRTDEIAEKLNLTDEIKDNVITYLRGWLHESILKQLDMGKSPIVSREDFINCLHRAVQKESDIRVVVMAKHFVKGRITKEQIEESTDKNFVRQLEMIEHIDKNNIIIDAIDDFLCAETERTRLTLKGDISRQELEVIDDSGRERWKEVFRRKVTQIRTDMSDEELGALAFEIYDLTVHGHLIKIRGFETESYFTKGSYHKLADQFEIGWYPHWEKYFTKT